MSAAGTDRWLTISEVALALGVNASTVKRWIRSGELPVLQVHEGGAVRVPARALRAHRKEADRA